MVVFFHLILCLRGHKEVDTDHYEGGEVEYQWQAYWDDKCHNSRFEVIDPAAPLSTIRENTIENQAIGSEVDYNWNHSDQEGEAPAN